MQHTQTKSCVFTFSFDGYDETTAQGHPYAVVFIYAVNTAITQKAIKHRMVVREQTPEATVKSS